MVGGTPRGYPRAMGPCARGGNSSLLPNNRLPFIALGGVATLAKSEAAARSDWAAGGFASDGAGESCLYLSPGSSFDALLYVAFIVGGDGTPASARACPYAYEHRHWC